MKKDNTGNKMHYAWFILISCCVLYGTTTGMLINCQGVFHTAIYQDMGWKFSDYCRSTIWMGLCASVMLLFADWFFKKVNTKLLLSVCIVGFAGAFALRGAANTIFQFCIVYGVAGITGAYLLYLSIPLLINNWFVKKRSLALSIAFMSAGLTGVVMNPIMSSLIQKYGWRTASYINGIIVMALALPFVIGLVVKTPEEKGMKAYGDGDEVQQQGETIKAKKQLSSKEKTALVAICFIIGLLVNFTANSPQQLANYAFSNGLTESIGAFMVSLAMVGNISSKLIIGSVVDRIGEIKTYVGFMIILIIGFLAMMFNPPRGLVLYGSSLITGFSCGLNVLLPPMAIASFSSNEEYTKNLSKANIGTMLMTAFSMFVGGWMFDLAGNYSIYLITCVTATVISLILTVIVFKKSKL